MRIVIAILLSLLLCASGLIAQGTRNLERESEQPIKTDQTKLKLYHASKNAPFSHPFYWSPFILIGNWK